MNIFPNFNGVAVKSDLETASCRKLIALLEKEQSFFLEQGKDIRSPEYRWPLDPLHTWSRMWEYPYVYKHLNDYLSSLDGDIAHIVDLGCGVTFFPFAVARFGAWVTGTDVDPICGRDIASIAPYAVNSSGRVDFAPTDGVTLPFDSGSIDVVYCISVLEHIPDFTSTIREVARILRPNGLFILTVDLDLRGDSQINVAGHNHLKSTLMRKFIPFFTERSVHPGDLLTSRTGPYPLPYFPITPRNTLWILKRCLLMLIKRKFLPFSPPYLVVEGMVLQKKEL